MITLTKPLAFIDTETTGLDTVKDRIISLAIATISDSGGKPAKRDYLLNPGISIPPTTTEVHHITDEMVKGCPGFHQVALEIHGVLSNCDLGGFNLANFDIPILWEEFYRCGIEWDLSGVNVVDVGMIYKKKEPRTLTAGVEFYLGRDHSGAHNAMDDTLATLEIFEAQTSGRPRYGDVSAMDIPAISRFCSMDERDGTERVDLAGTIRRRKDGVIVFGTKRNKGVPISADLGFAEWILRSDFPAQTRKLLRKIVDDIIEHQQDGGQERLL